MENRLVVVDPTEDLTAKSVLPVNTANTLQVDSQSSLELAGEIIRTLKDLQDEINKTFKPIVKQAHLAHKAAKKAQNDHLEPLQNAEAALRTRINFYLRQLEVERTAAAETRRKAEENLKQQPAAQMPLFSASSVPAPKLPEVPAPAKAEGMHTVEDWKWVVVDVAAIPAEYWILDEAALTQAVNQTKGETNIPGIKVWSEKRAVIKR